MSNLLTRTITGVIFVAVVVGSAIYNFWAFASVFGIFTIAGTLEFYKMIGKYGVRPFHIFGTIIAFSVYTITVFSLGGLMDRHVMLFYFIVFAASFLIFIAQLYKRSDTPFLNIAYTYLGIIYLAVPFSLLIVMSDFGKESFTSFTFPLTYFILIWVNDIFAYLVGSAIGKHRLFERISPKKSWEGAIGGFIFTIIFAFILSLFYTFLNFEQWLGLASVIVVFGNFGDLAESMLKRSFDCKDSGTFFPGHGGILDRFDSLLFSAPFVYVYLEIIKNL